MIFEIYGSSAVVVPYVYIGPLDIPYKYYNVPVTRARARIVVVTFDSPTGPRVVRPGRFNSLSTLSLTTGVYTYFRRTPTGHVSSSRPIQLTLASAYVFYTHTHVCEYSPKYTHIHTSAGVYCII